MDSDDERMGQFDGHSGFAQQQHINSQSLGIVIAIFERQTRGSGLKKHTVYLIKGQDKKGSFEVWRRFNEFSEMRNAMVKVWPGCLIPSLPSKNPILKNEQEINKKRQRYLNDFLKKMALRDYLYYSEQFQLLLRSGQSNLSDTFAKWPIPSPDMIITRYKATFAVLAGKQINNSTVDEIFDFYHRLEKNQKTLVEYRKVAKEMAFLRDRYNKYYLEFFKAMKGYQDKIVSNYTQPEYLVYVNLENKECRMHEESISRVANANPYWLVYDLIKNQERDGRAFQELLKSMDYYAEKSREIQGKIDTNVKGISDASAGKKSNMKAITMKGTPEEVKYQLQIETEQLKKDKEATQTLRDIIIALIRFIEISQYKIAKKQFYEYTMNKIAKFEQHFTGVGLKVWAELQTAIERLVEVTL